MMSESGDITPDSDIEPAAAARQVSITFNNFSSSALHLRGSSLAHGIFNPGPPETIYAGTSASWQAESSGVLTGTEGSVWYVPEDGQTEFELYWDNPAVGSNSYSSSVKNGNSEVWSLSNAGTSGNSSSVTYSLYEKLQQWDESSWMKGIEDNRSLGRLSIPGTHESGATYSPDGDILGVVITQDQSITQQLNSGIRFLDIRCRVENGIFTIHHDVVYQNKNFGDVLNECVGFLTTHPSETILMRIKQEYSTVSDAEFNAIFNNYYRPNYSSYLFTESRVPTLGEVRRKITVISNVSGLPGIPWDLLVVQDNYNPSGGLYEKTEAISENLSAAIANHTGGGNTLYLNFISKQGEPLVQTINQAAAKLNAFFLNLLGEKQAPVAIGVGIIAMDFPNRTGGAIPVIINSNFRLVNEQFYVLTQWIVPRVIANGTATLDFTFATDGRPAVPGSRLHAVAPPGTRIVSMSYQPPETLSISGDGKTADVTAGNNNGPWSTNRTIVIALNSDAQMNTLLKGSLQYYTGEGLPGTQTDIGIATLSHTLSISGTYFHVLPGGTVQLELQLDPYDISPPADTEVWVEVPANAKIDDVIRNNNFIELNLSWEKDIAKLTVFLANIEFNVVAIIKVNEDAPMDIDIPVYVTHYPPDGSAGVMQKVILNTASQGIAGSETGDSFFAMAPGESSTVTFVLDTFDKPATPGSRLHATVPEHIRIVDMSHSDHEVLTISADGRTADVIAVSGDGPWERVRTITAMADSDTPHEFTDFGMLKFLGPTGMEAVNSGYLLVYVT